MYVKFRVCSPSPHIRNGSYWVYAFAIRGMIACVSFSRGSYAVNILTEVASMPYCSW
jgi:hypothetical protein